MVSAASHQRKATSKQIWKDVCVHHHLDCMVLIPREVFLRLLDKGNGRKQKLSAKSVLDIWTVFIIPTTKM